MPEWLDWFVEIMARLIEGYCLWILLAAFGQNRYRRKKVGVSRCINGTAGKLVVMLLWFWIGKAISYFMFPDGEIILSRRVASLLLRFGFAYLFGIFLFRLKQQACLLAVLLFTSFTYISGQIGSGMCSLLFYGIDQMARRMDVINTTPLISVLITAVYLIGDVVTVLLAFVSTKYVVRNYKYPIDEKGTKELLSHILPVVMGSLAAVILYFVFCVINVRGNITFYDDIGIYFFITVTFFAIWIGILYSFKLQQEMMRLFEEQVQKSVLENQIIQMQNSVTEIQHFYENVRHVRHDMKNQMAVLERLLSDESETAKGDIRQYFGDMQQELLQLEPSISTGNAISDAVIGTKFLFAERKLPDIHLDAEHFMLSEKVKIRAYDIGVILNNGLDNAIEACRRLHLKNPDADMVIFLRSFWRQNMFFIEIENSFDGEIRWGTDGYPMSLKGDQELHGIGLKNIRHCALKYMGDMECVVQDGRFILSVMLKG